MYQIGEYVVCGSKGVCSVEKITTLDISGVDKSREYYILKPVYTANSTVYVPVDTAETSLRRVLTEEEARKLVDDLAQIPLITNPNEKMMEQEYKNCLRTDCCREWFRIIKTIWNRRRKRLEAGRKMTAVDVRYYKIAQDCVYGELAVALGMPRAEVENRIEGMLEEAVCV